MDYILSLDQGTTSSRAQPFGPNGSLHGSAQVEFEQLFPEENRVEHDSEVLWTTQFEAINEVLEKEDITVYLLAVIGITNQRETTVTLDRTTGEPLGTQNNFLMQFQADLLDCPVSRPKLFDSTSG